MKKTILSLTMLLCVGSAFGQTVDKLMEKWKAIEGAEYSETTEATRKSIEESREKGAEGLSNNEDDAIISI